VLSELGAAWVPSSERAEQPVFEFTNQLEDQLAFAFQNAQLLRRGLHLSLLVEDGVLNLTDLGLQVQHDQGDCFALRF